jgi:hypothetical protein
MTLQQIAEDICDAILCNEDNYWVWYGHFIQNVYDGAIDGKMQHKLYVDQNYIGSVYNAYRLAPDVELVMEVLRRSFG